MRTVTTLQLLSLLAFLNACSHHSPPAARAGAPGPVAAKSEPATEEGCSACGGEWAAHGLLGAQQNTMTCLCPTPDSGKRCRDGVECQGECVTDGADHKHYQCELLILLYERPIQKDRP